jgi:hypothetical protein
MPVPLGDSFNVAVARPVDSRSIWTGALENLNDTKNKYPGLFTYVTGANQYYYYVNDQWVYVQTVTTTNQTFSGVKNFSSRPVVNQTGIVLSGEAVRSNGTVNSMIKLTQAQYNALSPVDPTTFYVIVG